MEIIRTLAKMPFSRHQALQNAAFLQDLRRTGNVRDTCRALGLNRSTFTKRRARDAAFAADWDAALAIAHAALRDRAIVTMQRQLARPEPAPARTRDGQPRATRTRTGRLQLRRAQAGRLTRAAEQAFLAALSATANVRLSAAAAGFSHSAFYHRRKHSPAFVREFRLALQQGYERVELALLESMTVESCADDAWRHNDPPAMPRMTPDQALQLLHLHQKEARLQAEPAHIKRRRGESSDAHAYRMSQMYQAGLERDREAYRIAEAARAERRARSLHEPPAPVLPALDQVTGWSKATGQPPHHEERALFGGWRLEDIEKRK